MLQFVRQHRRRRVALALSAGCFVLAMPGMAAAGSVLDEPPAPVSDTLDKTVDGATTTAPPPVDTVEETVDSVMDPVQESTKPVTDAVDEVTKPVRDSVGDPVDAVTDTVDEPTKPVTDIIDEPTKPVIDVRDGGNGGGSRADPTGDTSGSPSDGSNRIDGRAPGKATSPTAGVPGSGFAANTEGSRALLPDETLTADRSLRSPAAPEPSATDRVAQAVVDASRAFRVPLLLAAALLLFLAIQGRLDSRDPKLAHAPEDEELMFA